MVSITSLPDEVSVIILGDDNISIEDALSFISTCTKFQHILSNNNKFWEKKYYERCPTARKKYNTKEQKKYFDHLNFEEKIKASIKCIKKLQHYVSLTSDNNLMKKKKIRLECFLCSTAEDSMMYYFVLDDLNRIISAQSQWQDNFNLTSRYNFGLISYYLKQYRFIYKLIKFLNMPKEKQLLEQLLTIVAQYFQPHISYSVIRTWLNDIAQEIRRRLRNKYPKHSIFSTSLEQFDFWRDNNIYDNFWNPTEAKQIMPILKEFIFSDLDVHQLLISLDLNEDEYINCISEFVRRYLLTITFHSVARRLGIHCVVVPSDIQIRSIEILWNPKYNAEDFKYTEYLFMTEELNLFYPSNIVRKKCNYNKQFDSLDYTWIRSKKRQAKKRKERIKFAVGMIVTHSWKLYYPYNAEKNNHDGVIIGWHYQCDPMFKSKLGKTLMFPYLRKCYGYNYHICICKKSSDNFDQPHYIILTENNKICYMEQDHISSCASKLINNIEIGRYFSKFEDTYYVPNASLAKRYPSDTAAILEMFSNQ